MTDLNAAFHWKCEPVAEKLILDLIPECTQLKEFEKELLQGCSAELISFIDHIALPYSLKLKDQVIAAGFKEVAKGHFLHPAAMLPHLLLQTHTKTHQIFISVESIASFYLVRGIERKIEGSPYSGYRRSLWVREGDKEIWVVERRGVLTCEPTCSEPEALQEYIQAKERWMTRPRHLENEQASLEAALRLAVEIADRLGKAPAALLVLECERAYWQAKNRAGQIQKARQDALGLGWANHDHHTFRSSRQHFTHLVRLFEILGFHCRERFYAGEEAGWGAQVMENSDARATLFLDVDLKKDEIALDFAHEGLPERSELGTIGLWCALHGDSILSAGMHHLEAQFLFEELKEALAREGIVQMDPFSNFPYLKQAFTKGEMWKVDERRVKRLLQKGQITEQQAERFLTHGAVGSHLENLQRKEGYKGFNQKNVSLIIKKTDPRTLHLEQDAPVNG